MPHTCEDDFQHFLSYSGLRNEPEDIINKMRLAFEAAWEPHETEITNATQKEHSQDR